MTNKKRGPKPRFGENMVKLTVWLPPRVAAWVLGQTSAPSEGLAVQEWLVTQHAQAQPEPTNE